MKKLLFIPALILIGCGTSTQIPKGKLILKGIEVTPDKVIFHGTLKEKGITLETLQKQISEATKGIFSIDKLYVDPADTSSNADFTLTTPNPQ